MWPYAQSFLTNGCNSLCKIGKLKFIHVCIDTCSRYLFPSLHLGEASKCNQSLFTSFFIPWDYPKSLRQTIGPVYTGNNFFSFCKEFGFKHKTEIPYNPIGQGIIEHAHCTLKN